MQYDRLTSQRVYIFSAHDEMQRSADASFRFQQEPHFFWLTGINEPGWQLVVDTYENKRTLLAPVRSAEKQLFDGGMSDEVLLQKARAGRVIEQPDQDAYFKELAARVDEVCMVGPDPRPAGHVENPALAAAWSRVAKYFQKVSDCRAELAALRAIKTPEEVATLQAAIDATVRGFEGVQQRLTDGTGIHADGDAYEYELEADLSYAFRATGAGGHAYDPIVAGGANACTLHYSQNNDPLPKNGLVLIDAGAVVDGYAADITRTYSVGVPTAREKAVHAAVRAAHEKIIELIKPEVSLAAYSDGVDAIMQDALISLGLLQKKGDTETYRKYFPHAISHGLGIDVHESLGGFGVFKPGMVLTVEPGIYIPEEGIGVRIEDDILVTIEGNKNLSSALSTALY